MKKTLLAIATASTLLMGSMVAQAADKDESIDIADLISDLDTTGMTQEEIDATRGELVAKVKRCWGVPCGVSVSYEKTYVPDGNGGYRVKYKNH